jgi:hypothetical protein
VAARAERLGGPIYVSQLDRYITQAELRALSENYKRVAGFALRDVGTR